MPLPCHPVREDADAILSAPDFHQPAPTAVRKSLVPRKFYQLQLPDAPAKVMRSSAQFSSGGKSTGRIQQQSTRSEHAHCLTYDLMLRLRTFLHRFPDSILWHSPDPSGTYPLLSTGHPLGLFIKCPGKLLRKLCRIRNL